MSDSRPSRPTQPVEPSAPEEGTPASGSLATLRHPPLWIRWALTVIAFAALTTAVVVAIRGSSGSTAAENRAAREADREGQIVVAQDQAPHAIGLRRAATPRRALERAVATDVRNRIRHHELSGPVQRSRCTLTSHTRASRQAFRCTVQAGEVGYPFLGIVDLNARTVTWCKRDPPASPALDIPVSRRCRE